MSMNRPSCQTSSFAKLYIILQLPVQPRVCVDCVVCEEYAITFIYVMFSVYTFGVFYLVKRGVLIFVGEIIMSEKWPLLISLSTSLKGRPKYKKI